MADQRLHDDLQHLLAEIEGLQLEGEAIERLTSLVADIEAHSAEEAPPQHMIDTVDNLISSFETEHPTLTGVLNNLLVSLSNMGV